MGGEWNKPKPLKNTQNGLWRTKWFKPKWLLGRAEHVSTKEDQRMNKNFLLHFPNFSQIVEFCPFPRAKWKRSSNSAFSKDKTARCKKKEVSKARGIQEEENTTIVHMKHASSTLAFSRKPFKISGITDITKYVILRYFSWCLCSRLSFWRLPCPV